MAAKARRWLDPMTGDYVVESGGPRGDTTRASQVLLRLRMHRGSCAVMPTLGSRLHMIRKATPGAARLATSYVFEALDDLIRARLIREVDVTVDIVSVPGAGAALAINVSFLDTSSDQRSVAFTSAPGA